VALFLASSFYHFWISDRAAIAGCGGRHSAIFFLIAGTAVPTLLLVLDAMPRLLVLALVLGSPLRARLLKIFWIDLPDWLGMSLYLGLSAVVVATGHRSCRQLSGGASRGSWRAASRICSGAHLCAPMARSVARALRAPRDLARVRAAGAGATSPSRTRIVERRVPPF